LADVADTQQAFALASRYRTARAVASRERLLLGIAALFVLVGAITLYLGHPAFRARHFILVVAPFLATFSVAHVALNRLLPGRDPLLLPVAALLAGLGLLFLGRLARNFLSRQAIWLPLSVIAMLAITRIGRDLRWLRRYRYTWLAGGLLLLAATLLLDCRHWRTLVRSPPCSSLPWLSLRGSKT